MFNKLLISVGLKSAPVVKRKAPVARPVPKSLTSIMGTATAELELRKEQQEQIATSTELEIVRLEEIAKTASVEARGCGKAIVNVRKLFGG